MTIWMPPVKEKHNKASQVYGAVVNRHHLGVAQARFCTHIGLIGFSRTDFHVKYALTHSTYSFTAASVATGFDAGYFQYLAYMNANPAYGEMFEVVNGGPPFGKGLFLWMESVPRFPSGQGPHSVATTG